VSRYLTLNRIEFVVTYACNGRCKHCCNAPRRAEFPRHIDRSLAVEIARKVGLKFRPESIMTFGGEPLLYPEIVCAIHKEAANVGIPRREVITNGYWAESATKTKETARNLADAGVNEIDISVDAFHQEHIPLKIVRNTAEACLEVGIKEVHWNPCWLVSRDDENQYNRETKQILKELEDLDIRETEGNFVEPDGSALVNLKGFLPQKRKLPEGRCGDMPYTYPLDFVRAICIEPDGRVAVCKDFYAGDASKTDVVRIVEDYDPFKIPEMKGIIEDGMEGLANLARKKGIDLDPEGYYSICHMCTDIRRKVNMTQR